ncbi:hypothetical protein E4U60_006040 [Claviceps pazoutovae]|uniref:Palmitoyltransferase pfa4 n=1 Tax=Claviceps pazoutovae TaxID=1649127 RepID=A0A9P7M7B5_9HYPO|nr:hypothetical protein E4U60_006040 [Claviceps pazoutovae]
MIEGWQIERHEELVERGGRDWWDLHGPDGEQIKIEKVEFPYDLGIFTNMSQAMGTSNFLLWLLPFSSSPKVGTMGKGYGWTWEENGFNRKKGMWPPLDPETVRRANHEWPAVRRDFAAELRDVEVSLEVHKRMLHERQKRDADQTILSKLDSVESYDSINGYGQFKDSKNSASWRNIEGETLQDYGVDEDADSYASAASSGQDDIPLSKLTRRRRILHVKDVK